jgi:hypothetical protein
MIKKDDRTPEQMLTHRVLIVATDNFLSNWGEALGGASVCAWAVPHDNPAIEKRMIEWVESRTDMRRVRIVYETPQRRYSPRTAAHFHVYSVDRNHPALERMAALGVI